MQPAPVLWRQGFTRDKALAGPWAGIGRQSFDVAPSDGGLHSRDRLRNFRRLAGQSLGMTAHVIYDAIDETRPATLSPAVISEIIRGYIGFDGLLMSDDLSMKALSGALSQRTEASLPVVIATFCLFNDLDDRVM